MFRLNYFQLNYFNFNKGKFFLINLVVLFLFISCSKYQKLVKSTDNDKKYEAALSYYNKKDFYRALQLFDQFSGIYRGTSKGELIDYMYAKSYYEMNNYNLAAHYFSEFALKYPKSEKAEECAFLSAYCKYLESPQYSLDQTNTKQAIQELQLFINLYPLSSKRDECNKLIDNLRQKLELKAYEVAMLYYDTEEYNASITAFNTVISDYPDTGFKEQALYYIIKANFKLAINSIEIKKFDRYNSTLSAYRKFKEQFPESRYIKECNNIYNFSLKEINKLNKNI
ncbi:MAG: outer membrane protein assembly factor BamD [Bacteroidales bacterium]|nr:outer membrane protein assembly factor BamD [Bacteroidales bacterium]